MPPHILRVMPCAGLANRLRVIASAMCAAHDLKIPRLIIGWKYDPGIFVIDAETLFDMWQFPEWVTFVQMGPRPDPIWNNGKECNSELDWAKYYNLHKNGPVIEIKSWAAFYGQGSSNWQQFLRMLKPNPVIQARSFTDLLGVVGVHIRRTDHRVAIQHSPSAAFWSAMAAEPPNTIFYVASDSPDEKAEAERRFPGRILCGPSQLFGRGNSRGCADAMLDFYNLSKCSKILGSVGSSFSEIAGIYGGTLVVFVKSSA